MPDLSWRDAIISVLTGAPEPKHYTEIAELISIIGLRDEVGATPAATVASILSTSINSEGSSSPFLRTGRGLYALRPSTPQPSPSAPPDEGDTSEDTGLINALGMYWARSRISWSGTPKLLGQQQVGSDAVDFAGQHGVYLLHDGRTVIYVGRTTDQPLGQRLKQHTVDRLNSRWDRFSWFGVYPIAADGSLRTSGIGTYNLEMLIVTMEALLIEGLEPPQNRKRGDEFKAVEFLQVDDPAIRKSQMASFLSEMASKL